MPSLLIFVVVEFSNFSWIISLDSTYLWDVVFEFELRLILGCVVLPLCNVEVRCSNTQVIIILEGFDINTIENIFQQWVLF